MKKVGIIGSGVVAQSLGDGFLKYNYEVMLSSHDTSKLAAWKEKGGNKAHTGSFEQAAGFGDIAVLCVKGSVAADAIEKAGPQNLQWKTVIDVTNPIADAPPVNGVLKFFTTLDDSLMERLQREFPAARLVKAFNSVGAAAMVNPQFKGGPPTMFMCGNDEGAKKTVNGILDQFGWQAEDLGGAEAARAMGPPCMLGCIPGFQKQDWVHA